MEVSIPGPGTMPVTMPRISRHDMLRALRRREEWLTGKLKVIDSDTPIPARSVDCFCLLEKELAATRYSIEMMQAARGEPYGAEVEAIRRYVNHGDPSDEGISAIVIEEV